MKGQPLLGNPSVDAQRTRPISDEQQETSRDGGVREDSVDIEMLTEVTVENTTGQ